MLKKGQSDEEELKTIRFVGRLLVTLKSSVIRLSWMMLWKKVKVENFTLCLELFSGCFRQSWATEKVSYSRALHVGLGSILRIRAEGKHNQKRQQNPAASTSEQSVQVSQNYAYLVGICRSFHPL